MSLRDFLSLAKYRDCETHIAAKKSALTVASRRYLMRVTIVYEVEPLRKTTTTGFRNFLGAIFQIMFFFNFAVSLKFYRKIHYLTREFRIKLHAKTDIARIAKR